MKASNASFRSQHRPSTQASPLTWTVATFVLLSGLLLPAGARAVQATTSSAAADAISITDYSKRLQSLDQIVAACQRATTPANCRSEQVGSDILLALPTGSRPIHFNWLRALLDDAAKQEKPKPAKPEPARPANPPSKAAPETGEDLDFPAPTLAQRLEDARSRLAADSRQAAQLAAQQAGNSASSSPSPSPSPSTSAKAPADSSSQRRALTTILAAKEYNPAIVGPSLKDRILEKVANWIDKALDNIAKAGAKSKWIGPTAEVLFCLLLCIALAWFFIRLERQGRFNPAMLSTDPGPGAASARDWQLWLEDARQAAARAAWRDAIHLIYWASISRLESSGLWPADRARTPREYLALLSAENDQRSNLIALTRSFERTWYAGRRAVEADFLQAEQLAASLGISSSAKSASRLGAR